VYQFSRSRKTVMWYLIDVTQVDNVTSTHLDSIKIGENGPNLALMLALNDTLTRNEKSTPAQGNVIVEILKPNPSLCRYLNLH
jgi:hypothetical protein